MIFNETETLELMEDKEQNIDIEKKEQPENKIEEVVTEPKNDGVNDGLTDGVNDGVEIKPEPKTVKVIIVDSTSFSIRSEIVFFGKRMEEIEFELLDRCKTTVIHKIKEYDLQVLNEVETEVNQPVETISKTGENTLMLLEVRRDIIKVAKSVLSKKAKKRLLKKSDDLDAIIINEKLD